MFLDSLDLASGSEGKRKRRGGVWRAGRGKDAAFRREALPGIERVEEGPAEWRVFSRTVVSEGKKKEMSRKERRGLRPVETRTSLDSFLSQTSDRKDPKARLRVFYPSHSLCLKTCSKPGLSLDLPLELSPKLMKVGSIRPPSPLSFPSFPPFPLTTFSPLLQTFEKISL